MSTLDSLIARGFDNSRLTATDSDVLVICSQCEALVINGVATHERGCPNQIHECKGCNNAVPRAGMYCEECQ